MQQFMVRNSLSHCMDSQQFLEKRTLGLGLQEISPLLLADVEGTSRWIVKIIAQVE